jgi:hypothetical protein
MRKNIHDYELKYSKIQKKAISLEKIVVDLKNYILPSHIIAYVPTSLMKMLPNQQLRERKRENWLEKI